MEAGYDVPLPSRTARVLEEGRDLRTGLLLSGEQRRQEKREGGGRGRGQPECALHQKRGKDSRNISASVYSEEGGKIVPLNSSPSGLCHRTREKGGEKKEKERKRCTHRSPLAEYQRREECRKKTKTDFHSLQILLSLVYLYLGGRERKEKKEGAVFC